MRKLDAIRQAGAVVQDIVLTPLGRDDLGQLLADSLHCEPERAAPLAELIHEKTTGNPFFAIQFISALADEGLLTFDYGERRWVWDLQPHSRQRLYGQCRRADGREVESPAGGDPEGAPAVRLHGQQRRVRDAADGVSRARSRTCTTISGKPCGPGLIFRADDSYRFLHDRVQEAAYSLIPKELRAEAHLRIGMLLAAHTPPAKREEAIFEIVNQLNRGSHLIASVEERERVADLNLIAGRRAKSSTAYDSALKYLRAGSALLTEETWQRNYELVFSIEYLMAECELLTADMVGGGRSPLAAGRNAPGAATTSVS